jgi:hypothetical protein
MEILFFMLIAAVVLFALSAFIHIFIIFPLRVLLAVVQMFRRGK